MAKGEKKPPGQVARGQSKMAAHRAHGQSKMAVLKGIKTIMESEMATQKEKHIFAEELVKVQIALKAETIACLRAEAGLMATSPEPEKPVKPVCAEL